MILQMVPSGGNSNCRPDDEWHRVSRNYPCPVCGKPDWCGYFGRREQPVLVNCQRCESSRPSKTGGWIHHYADGVIVTTRRKRIEKPQDKPASLFPLLDEYADRITTELIDQLATDIGVNPDSLVRLRVGWDGQAYTIPVLSGDGRLQGIQRRLPNGKKLSVVGSRMSGGFFIPRDLERGRAVFITEGASDCAAVLSLGLNAVGRYNAQHYPSALLALHNNLRAPGYVIVADQGTAIEKRTAIEDAKFLNQHAVTRVVYPPYKDVRAWLKHGLTLEQLVKVSREAMEGDL